MTDRSGRKYGNEPIYPGKTERVQGVITPTGAKLFEKARRHLAYAHNRQTTSDGETIEFLARSWGEAQVVRDSKG